MYKVNRVFITIVIFMLCGCGRTSKSSHENENLLQDSTLNSKPNEVITSIIDIDTIPPCYSTFEELTEIKVNGYVVDKLSIEELNHNLHRLDSVIGFDYYYGSSFITYNKRVVSIFICDSNLLFTDLFFLGQSLDSVYKKYPCIKNSHKSNDEYNGQKRISIQLTFNGLLYLRIYLSEEKISELWFYVDDSDYDSYNR